MKKANNTTKRDLGVGQEEGREGGGVNVVKGKNHRKGLNIQSEN